MSYDAIAAILERRIGLDPASLGPSALPDAIADRQRILALADTAIYASHLEARPEEFAALVEKLIVPETWFFRGAGLFEELARIVASTLPARRPFRALSLPCSTGEEPYSLAITFLEAGIPSEHWTIDGVDLSPHHIELARRGVFRDFSFRQTEAGLRDRYFRPSPVGWQLDPQVLGCVRFHVGNVLDLPAADAYDLILCRNLLIYLTADARRRALDGLETMLPPGGLLAVGHAEPQTLAGRGYRRIGPESHFVFCRESTRPELPTQVRTAAHRRVEVRTAPLPTPPPPPILPPAPQVALEDPMTRARRLADAGRLDEALEACRSHLKLAAPTAHAYSLLGAIHQARGDRTAAADAFRKSLYLDPDNRDALTHSLLLATQRGDTARVTSIRDRLNRHGSGGDA